MTYFLAGLVGLAGSSGLALGGRPFPGTLRMASMALSSYSASLVTGLIPSLKSRCLAVRYVIPSFFAISVIVKPFILLKVSAKILKKLMYLPRYYIDIKYFMEKINKIVFFPINLLTLCIFLDTIIHR